MGIARGSARLLLDEHRERPFSGRILQLGRSSLYFRRDQLEGWALKHEVTLADVPPGGLSHDPRLARQGLMDDESFFRLLGFDAVESCDISEWEGADHIVNLNEPVPEALHGRFDAVFETGTSVQVFHLPRLLENLFLLLKPGGRVIHSALPSNNHMDLGFYMVSPTLLDDFYRANEWRIEAEYLCEYFTWWHGGRLYSNRWRIYRYTPGCLDHLSYGRYGGEQAAVFLIATKTPEATGDAIPQLGQYRQSWQDFEHAEEPEEVSAGQRPDAEARGGLLQGPAGAGLKRLVEPLRRILPRRMPPLVARY